MTKNSMYLKELQLSAAQSLDMQIDKQDLADKCNLEACQRRPGDDSQQTSLPGGSSILVLTVMSQHQAWLRSNVICSC